MASALSSSSASSIKQLELEQQSSVPHETLGQEEHDDITHVDMVVVDTGEEDTGEEDTEEDKQVIAAAIAAAASQLKRKQSSSIAQSQTPPPKRTSSSSGSSSSQKGSSKQAPSAASAASASSSSLEHPNSTRLFILNHQQRPQPQLLDVDDEPFFIKTISPQSKLSPELHKLSLFLAAQDEPIEMEALTTNTIQRVSNSRLHKKLVRELENDYFHTNLDEGTVMS